MKFDVVLEMILRVVLGDDVKMVNAANAGTGATTLSASTGKEFAVELKKM